MKSLLKPLMEKKNGELLNIHKTLIRHEKLYKRWGVFGSHIMVKSSLPAREREILILRIGWLCQSEYEWGQHVRIGKKHGLTDEEIKRIIDGPESDKWDPFDKVLLKAVDELYYDSFISDFTWEALNKNYDIHQLLDLIFTVGQYNLVSMALNSLGVQLEPGTRGFPKD